MSTELEKWFHKRMVKELKDIAEDHGTHCTLHYVIGILEHDLSIEEVSA